MAGDPTGDADINENPLVSEFASENSPHVQLHPIVLISQDDHATRYGLRKQGVAIGAILGQQNGKEITMEHAFECGSGKLVKDSGGPRLSEDWFNQVLQHNIETHPQLTLVGWYTFDASPQPWHARIHTQLKTSFNCDSAIFLLYHPDKVEDSSNGKLPFTIYESILAKESGSMDVDYPDDSHPIKFRPVAFAIETAPAEAIALADIAQGASTAAAYQDKNVKDNSSKDTDVKDKKGKGKEKAKETDDVVAPVDYLSPEEETLVASLRTKANAIAVLKSRLDLLSSYLKSQPASYLTDASLPRTLTDPPLNHEILRSISALTAQLNILSPADLSGFAKEVEQTKTDVELINLLSTLTRNVSDVKQLGKRWHLIEPRKRATGYALSQGQPSLVDQGEWTGPVDRMVS